MTGYLLPKSLRVLRHIHIGGALSLEELALLDPPLADDMRNIINGLNGCKYVVSDRGTRKPKQPARYALTKKGHAAIEAEPRVHRVAKKPECSLGAFPVKAPVSWQWSAKASEPAIKPGIAGPKAICNSASQQIYNPSADMLAPSARKGSDAAMAVPSRYGDRLHYRDGRVVAA